MKCTKIWIGNNPRLRKKILSLIDVEKYGGKSYFRGCTSIYFYNEGLFDIRVSKGETEAYFKKHTGVDIKVL